MASAMPTVRVTVDGVSRLAQDLAAIGAELDDLKEVMADVADEVADIAARLAPRNTGALARSIKGKGTAHRATIKAGGTTRVPYAGPINYGWKARNIKPSRFMQRADWYMKPRTMSRLQTAIDRMIKERDL